MYGFGVIGPDPRQSWFMIAGITVGCIVVVAAATGILLFPGFVILAIVRSKVNTPRGVCVADQGIAVTREGFWNAKPKSIVVQLPLDALFAVTTATQSHLCLQLGSEQVWLRRNEHEILVHAAQVVRRQLSTPAQY